MANLDTLLTGLRAAAEHTRLRLLALCEQRDLSVNELTQILGQSQPRVSRHLKVLVRAGLLERYPEGSQVFYRRAEEQVAEMLSATLLRRLEAEDPVLTRDHSRLEQVVESRNVRAQEYFQQVAARWDELRSLHVPQEKLERALLQAIGTEKVDSLLDIGTGTGRILEILSGRVEQGTGVDTSNRMLAVARANLEHAGLPQLRVRQADMYNLPFDDGSFDLVTIHQVLHYSDEPGKVIAEAARVLRPRGRIFLVDVDAHSEEYLRTDYQHRRLGFTDSEIRGYFKQACLSMQKPLQLVGDPLTMKIWEAIKAHDVVSLDDVRAGG